MEIQTICLGLSPAEVELLVTVPLENALAGVPGVDVMRSKSVDQLSSVLLIFKPGVDELQVRQLVTERVAIVTSTLPTWAAPPHMMPPLSATSRVMKIGITSKDKSVMDLSMLAYWNIRNKLLGVPGVANVAIWGEQLKMLMVEVDPERLARFNVTLDEVQEVVSDALDVGLLRYSGGAHIGTGGFLETPNQRMSLRFISTGVTPETLARVPVETRDGKPLLAGRRGRSGMGRAGRGRRRDHQRRSRPDADRREVSVGQHGGGHQGRGGRVGGDEAGPDRRRNRHDDFPACHLRRRLDRQPRRTRCCWAASWSRW